MKRMVNKHVTVTVMLFHIIVQDVEDADQTWHCHLHQLLFYEALCLPRPLQSYFQITRWRGLWSTSQRRMVITQEDAWTSTSTNRIQKKGILLVLKKKKLHSKTHKSCLLSKHVLEIKRKYCYKINHWRSDLKFITINESFTFSTITHANY
jgi:hypothetical protein